MTIRLRLILFATAVAVLFLLINRPAYRAFFADDDLDNLANARDIHVQDIARTFVSPQVTGGDNFRVTTYAFYFAIVRAAKLNYAPYVASIHAIHLINVLLIFLLARALGAEILGACAAALLYAFHAAAFDVYWKAMYAFDLLCATFTLAALLAYVRNRWILALLFFWLSLRAKEVTIFFPFALAAYEYLLGERRWRRLLPFFAISILAGFFAMGENRGTDTDYTFRFTLAALAKTSAFYSGKVALAPYAGFALLALPFFTRDRRVWFGIALFLILLGPMLFLPGRLFAAYLYAPLIGLAIAISVVTRPVWLAVFFLLWIPWNYRQFRFDRKEALDLAYERRNWFRPFEEFMRAHPETDTFIWDGSPASVPDHYISGAARMLRDGKPARVTWVNAVSNETQAQNLVVLVWDQPRLKLHVLGRQPDLPYIHTDEDAPLWQLTSGWTGNQGHLRWTKPRATVRLQRPASATALEVVVSVFGFDRQHPSRMDVSLNGAHLGTASLADPKETKFRFPIAAAPEGSATVELAVTPPFHDPNGPDELGQPILALGFVAD